LGLGLLVTAALTLLPRGPLAGLELSLAFLPFPFLLCAALRFGPCGAASAALLLSAVGVWGTARGVGPFRHPDPVLGLVLLWAFMSTAALVSLLLTALQAERDAAERALRQSEERLQAILDQTPAV